MTSPHGPATIPGLSPAGDAQNGAIRPDGHHFERVANGYHPGHVDNFIRGLYRDLREAQHRAAQAVKVAERGVADVAETPQGRQLLVDFMKLAFDELTQERAAAAADGARLIEDAKAEAEAIIAGANSQASSTVGGAREQADALLASARSQATETLDRATAQAAAVNQGAARRLDAISKQHQVLLDRIGHLHAGTGQMLHMETERGTLEEEVRRIAGGLPEDAAPAVTASAPAQLTASAETTGPQE